MNDSPLLPYNTDALALDPKILENFQTYDDYLGYYIELDQASSTFSWLKADLLNDMVHKLGENSVAKLAGDIRQPASTIGNYARVAKAFPREKRDVGASFSLHFQASFADSLDEQTKEFDGEKRFEWLNKAIDDNLSTRKLAEQIQNEKMGVEELEPDAVRMMLDAQDLVIEIKHNLDILLKDIKKNSNKHAYFKIVRVREVMNERYIQ